MRAQNQRVVLPAQAGKQAAFRHTPCVQAHAGEFFGTVVYYIFGKAAGAGDVDKHLQLAQGIGEIR